MSNRLQPVVGHWYLHRDKGAVFQIVALDESAGTIEIQEFEGDLDELDVEDWHTLSVDAAAPPDDWGGSVDDVEPDEFGYTDFQVTAGPGDPLESMTTNWQEIVEDDDFDETPIH